jgi:hypothetical protein
MAAADFAGSEPIVSVVQYSCTLQNQLPFSVALLAETVNSDTRAHIA